MNIVAIESRFSPDMLRAIRDEIDAFVQDKFTLDDYTINNHLIETFFVQPLYYATLLNYYTMYEQRSTLSMGDIYRDDKISPAKKDAFFSSLAQAVGLGSASGDHDALIGTLENMLTISDTKIHSDMMNIVKSYDKAIDGATGVFWTMYRNAPDMMYFSKDKFGIPVIYENIISNIEIVDLVNQPILMTDVNKYQNMSNGGRVTNYIDIYLKPETSELRTTVTLTAGETRDVVLPVKKWKHIDIPEDGKENVSCTAFEGGYIGFGDRSITLHFEGPYSGTVVSTYYDDDVSRENEIISENSAYDIKFFGLIPLFINIKLRNGNYASKVADELGAPLDGSTWSGRMSDINRLLSKHGNGIIEITGDLYINPLCKKEVRLYNDALALSQNSIFSWIDIDNTCVQASSIIDSETGNVITV